MNDFGYRRPSKKRVCSFSLLVDDRALVVRCYSCPYIVITARSDYCSTLYTGTPTIRLSCLDCVLRSAARLNGQILSCHQKLAQTCPKYGENQSIGARW